MMILQRNQFQKLLKKYLYNKEAYNILKKYYGNEFDEPENGKDAIKF